MFCVIYFEGKDNINIMWIYVCFVDCRIGDFEIDNNNNYNIEFIYIGEKENWLVS